MENEDWFKITSAGNPGMPMIVLTTATSTEVMSTDQARQLILRLQQAVDRAEH